MAEVEDEIVEAGAEIIWVLEKDHTQEPGTMKLCMDTMDEVGSLDQGWCVGDSQTLPTPMVFDDSPFSIARGFDMVVTRETMEIVWVSTHGTPAGNENLSGEEVLAAVKASIDKL